MKLNHVWPKVASLFILAACDFLSVGGASGRAQELRPRTTGISVIGVGEVKIRPNLIELEGKVSGAAELANDAAVKYRSNRKQAIDTIEAAQVPGLKVQPGKVEITSAADPSAMQAMMRGMPAQTSNQQLTFVEPLVLRVEGVDSLTDEQVMERVVKVFDVCKDAGLAFGTPQYNPYYGGFQGTGGLITFKLANEEEARGQAMEKAMASAKSQAERLAKLSGAKLGKVKSIREGAPPTQSNPYPYVIYGYVPPTSDKSKYSTPNLEPIPVSCTLEVEFEIGE